MEENNLGKQGELRFDGAGVSGTPYGVGFGDGFGSHETKKSNKKIFVFVGAGVALLMVVVALFIIKPWTKKGTLNIYEDFSEETSEEVVEQIFNLAEFGLDDDATPEEIETKFRELGYYDVEEDVGGDIADDYCADDTCEDQSVMREKVQVDADADVLDMYSEEGRKFVVSTVEFYFSTVYADVNSVEMTETDERGILKIIGGGKEFRVKISEDNTEVVSVAILNSDDEVVYTADAKYSY